MISTATAIGSTVAPVTSTLLEDIEVFLRETGLTPSGFSQKAMGDPNFVRELRDGRDVLFATENKARTQMEKYRDSGEFEDPRKWPVRRVIPKAAKQKSPHAQRSTATARR